MYIPMRTATKRDVANISPTGLKTPKPTKGYKIPTIRAIHIADKHNCNMPPRNLFAKDIDVIMLKVLATNDHSNLNRMISKRNTMLATRI